MQRDVRQRGRGRAVQQRLGKPEHHDIWSLVWKSPEKEGA